MGLPAFRYPPSPLGGTEGHGAGMLAVPVASGILSDTSWQRLGEETNCKETRLNPSSPRECHRPKQLVWQELQVILDFSALAAPKDISSPISDIPATEANLNSGVGWYLI